MRYAIFIEVAQVFDREKSIGQSNVCWENFQIEKREILEQKKNSDSNL